MPRRVNLLRDWQHEASHKWGHDGLQFISRAALPDWIASERYQAGLFDPEGGHLNLLKLALGLAAATRPYLERVFPQIKGVELDFAWGGHIDLTLKRTPDIGRRGDLYWLQGYSGHGVLPTLAGARAVSDAILGRPENLALYQGLVNGSFPGGQYLAAPLEAIGKAWYRLRDSI